MALRINSVNRIFIIEAENKKDNITLADPNSKMEPRDVMKFQSGQYPELTSASVVGPKMRDGKAIYTFNTQIGEKG